MAILHIPPLRKWNHKQIILATMIGSLVVIAIAAVISIGLSPGHIFFSIQHPAIVNKTNEDTMYYNFILVAENSSPRMGVHYGALSAEVWYRETAWVPAVVDRSALMGDGTWQPPSSAVNISVSAEYWQSEQPSAGRPPPSSGENKPAPPPPPPPPPATSETDWSNCTVLVAASVWFKYGRWISTRAYDVRANCSRINFHNRTASVKCGT